MLHILQPILILSMIGGIVCTIVGATFIPQTITNNGNSYIGTAQAYEADLQKAQLASYGFRVVIIGLSITGGSFVSLVCSCYSTKLYCIEPRVEPIREIKQKIHPEQIIII